MATAEAGHAASRIYHDQDGNLHLNGAVIYADEAGTSISGTDLTATDGLTATATEINQVADVSARIVTSAATTITMTAAAHADRVLVLSSTHTQTITLPAASGTGDLYTILVSTKGTDGSKVIKVANTVDVVNGSSHLSLTDSTQAYGFVATATDDTFTMNNSTQGGLVGDTIVIRDVASGVFIIKAYQAATGLVVTPFSASV